MGMGIFTLLARLTKPVVVTCLLLPGTIVSELAYILGCLITGGEIRRSRIMPESKGGDGGQPVTEAQSRLGFFGPLVASTFAIVACGAAILAVNKYVDKGDVVHQFALKSDGLLPPKGSFDEKAPASGAAAVNYFWKLVHSQVDLLKRSTDVLGEPEVEGMEGAAVRVPQPVPGRAAFGGDAAGQADPGGGGADRRGHRHHRRCGINSAT